MAFIHPVITDALLEEVLRRYALDPGGIHGTGHWEQVEQNALYITAAEGVESNVFSLFALFHDSQRRNDGCDPNHGKRGAALARTLHRSGFFLTETELDQLCYACENHTRHTHHSDPVIGICWDADRLDLPRVGIIPDSRFLNTASAKAKLS